MSKILSRNTFESNEIDLAVGTCVDSVQTAVDDPVIHGEPVTEETCSAEDDVDEPVERVGVWHGTRWSRAVAYGLLPGLVLLLTTAAGFLKWRDLSVRAVAAASSASMQAATDGTITLLSYRADTVEKDLEAARGRLTGSFLNAYTSLTNEVVIPGAKQKQISAVATVPAAATISTSSSHAVVLLFVNQTLTIGQNTPTNTASSVRVSLDKVGSRWLISGFDPV